MTRKFLRLILHSLIASFVILILQFGVLAIKIKNRQLYSDNIYSFIVFLGVVFYSVTAYFNILLLNPNSDKNANQPNYRRNCYVDSIIYFAIILTVIKIVSSVISSMGTGQYDFTEALPLPGLLDMTYILFFPAIYIHFQPVLKNLRWLKR